MNGRIRNAVEHVKENRTAYIAGGVCFAVGAAGTAGSLLVLTPRVSASQRVIAWKPENVTQNLIQTTVLARRGHPGNVIKCNETGELFASQKRAAELLGIDRINLGHHLKGNRDNVSGYTFTKLGEAQVA